ncbi:MAG TPA: hypothetical protein VFR06_07500, partial [Gallionellaceae bacterium]|nr:hypothetical protein [Gallionellaceae bacterium]
MSSHKHLKNIGLILSLLAFSTNALGASTTLANAPLVTSSGASVLPNIFYVLDDSGSMDWNYMPDWANDVPPGFSSLPNYLFSNPDYNGVFYNPAIEYDPPVKADGTTYTSMTSANTATWSQVPNDGYGVQSTAKSNLVGSATFYTMVAGEYCASPNLKTCTSASAPTSSYPYAAKLRWCNSTALTTCQSINTSSYRSPRTPTPRTATIAVSGSSSTSVSSIQVGGVEILSGTTTASTTSSTVASNIATNINACSGNITGNCGTVGYSASVSGSTVTIQAPGTTTATPAVTKSGTMTLTASAFAHNIAGSAGENLRTDIVSTNNSYPFPGSTTKASTRNDCAGTTCTYAEEMTNYANWWSYYHTRMQMMKTSASKAFYPLCSDPDPTKCNYRVGYLSINDNTGSDFLNIKKFDATQKAAWFSKFTSAVPNNSTPLRVTLAKAGRLYAGKLNGTTLNGSTVTDPMEYSCQQNFTILSTDGYWNESSTPTKVDGTTAVGNQDNDEQRPMYDGTINGSTTTTTTVTSTTPTTTVVRKQTV